MFHLHKPKPRGVHLENLKLILKIPAYETKLSSTQGTKPLGSNSKTKKTFYALQPCQELRKNSLIHLNHLPQESPQSPWC